MIEVQCEQLRFDDDLEQVNYMSPTGHSSLPLLAALDFGPALDHIAEAHQQGKVFVIAHKHDPVRLLAPALVFPGSDPFTYVFVHGGEQVTRFENLARERMQSLTR